MYRHETPQHAHRRLLIITRGIRRRNEGSSTSNRRSIALQIVGEYIRYSVLRGLNWKYAEVEGATRCLAARGQA